MIGQLFGAYNWPIIFSNNNTISWVYGQDGKKWYIALTVMIDTTQSAVLQ